MAHNSTHQVDHYEIGAGDRLEIGGPFDYLASEAASVAQGAMAHEARVREDRDLMTPSWAIGAGERLEIGETIRSGEWHPDPMPWPANDYLGAGYRLEIGTGPSINEDAFPHNVSLGAEETALAVRQVIKTARDNRQPPPKMKAVAVDAPAPVEDDAILDWYTDIAIGCGQMIGAADPFPLTTKLLTRFGAGQERPRIVYVNTLDSYPAFCARISPELADAHAHIADLADKLEAHIADPNAHQDLIEAIDEAEALGAEVKEVEAEKEIELWLPEWARGKVHAWRQGEFICASIHLPGADGELRICTSITPVKNAIEEMERHAAEANVPAGAVVGVLPAMGCVLGAGTLVKEMAAAAPAILQHPEAAGGKPFVCRIEPKASPAICAFAALLLECSKGNKQACAEWDALVSAAGKSAPYVSQALREAKDIFLKACPKAA